MELVVATVVAGGDGLARDDDGRVTFVAGALPGERVQVEVVEQRKDFAKASIVAIVDPSPDRVAPPCPFVAAGCGGCDWQHVTPEAQRRLRASIVADALRRQARIEIEVDPGPLLPATGYRTTLRGVSANGRFGFRRRATHDPIAVDPCLVAHPLLEKLVEHGRFPDGEVTLRGGARTGERLVLLHGAGDAVVPDGVRVVTDAELRNGTRAWYHEELAGRRWRISARSFFQSRPDGAEALVHAATAALADLPADRRLVDLYGGVGLFAGAVPSGHVTVVENGASSIADARVNLADVDHRIVKADVAHWGPTHADAVIADPPRTGLAAAGVAKVAATGAERVVLVSCDAAALGRDALAHDRGRLHPPHRDSSSTSSHTSHVEVVSRFDRSGGR